MLSLLIEHSEIEDPEDERFWKLDEHLFVRIEDAASFCLKLEKSPELKIYSFWEVNFPRMDGISERDEVKDLMDNLKKEIEKKKGINKKIRPKKPKRRH